MNVTVSPEYRKLGLESSNDLIRHDARRGDGKYVEAAFHARLAGFARLRMGQIMFDSGEFVCAAEDWLSAAACFYLATDLERMREAFERVQKLEHEDRIPAERRDIQAAIKERAEQIKTLERKLAQFHEEYGRVNNQNALDWLLRQIRELSGFPMLHVAIALRAAGLRRFPLAFEHLEWVNKFAPENPNFGALQCRLLFASGERSKAIQAGREQLKLHPGLNILRIQLAQVIVSDPGAGKDDWKEAAELLRSLTEDSSADVSSRLLALSLAAILWHGLADHEEYHHVLNSFNQFTQTIQSPAEERVVSDLRRKLPHVFPQPGSTGTAPPSGSNTSSALHVVEELFAGAA